ncbi:cation diffusion facilitator family transporter [Svornostia abyssi]|uniref:Cation diffusion facilitator family transporter n=1 Tax=Svornostia abyssi TaxID=2898438 RepID=A0ABY5PJV1_9ACTN|nr:cation diffusion facilitator family transporter [Parviterribacteraceae bacterium J379]
MSTAIDPAARQRRLIRLVWLSIGAAILTIALKTGAWAITGSVGLLSDAAESVVNLVAASFALVIVHWADRPPDEEHAYGHEKADYLSAGLEGGLILIAAVTIGVAAVGRLIDPQPLESVGIGLAVSGVATIVNLLVARVLIRTGMEYRSLTVEADGRHLMTDVWTSIGVVIGVAAVALSGFERLDPIIALLVAANIIRVGWSLVRGAFGGLMDRALEPGELAEIQRVLDRFEGDEVQFHALRTRRAGRRAFVTVHVLVPGTWSVQAGHDLVEQVEAELRAVAEPTTVFTHLEPIEDPASFEDVALDREQAG